MRHDPAVLRFARAPRGVRPPGARPAAGDRLIGVPFLLGQDVAPDSLQRALREVFARNEYRWVDRSSALAWFGGRWRALLDWLSRLAEQHTFAFDVVLSLLVVVLVLLLVHVGYVVWRIVRPSAGTGGAVGAGRAALVLDARAHLARAAELARAGRYGEALAHRFLAVILELEEAGAARFHFSKTPAEYVGEARLDAEGRATLAGLVGRLYRHLFGAEPCDEAGYAAFGDAAQQVTRHVLPA